MDDLEVHLTAGKECLAVGVEDRAADLVGVEDLAAGATTLVEGKMPREEGVVDLEGFVVEGNVGRPVGVAGREVADVSPPDNEGLFLPLLEEFCPDGEVGCLGAMLLLEGGSAWILASLDFRTMGRALGISI